MKIGLFVLLLLSSLPCKAEEIVVITQTKVPLFSLPDGSVLTNAYAWRQDSRGIMIVHDGGNHFLNYALLPDDWKKVYLGDSIPEETVATPTAENNNNTSKKYDPYQLERTFESIPGLSKDGLKWLLQTNPSEEVTKKVFALGIVQNLLNKKMKKAKKILFFSEENEYTIEGIDLEKLFRACPKCNGNGSITTICKICSGTGKCVRCNGMGTRKSSFDKTRFHCTTCRGTGKCLACKGKGEFVRTCSMCEGRKKIIDTDYCTVLRNKWVREVNAFVDPKAWTAITATPFSPIKRTLRKIDGFEKGAKTFYLSTEYNGEMDTNLVVLCLMKVLQEKKLKEARYFNTMLTVLYPDSELIEIEKYLSPCKSCKGKGVISIPCPTCSGSGKCPRCKGKGTRKSEISYGLIKKKKNGRKKKDKDADGIYCTTCHGSGICPNCGGNKTVNRRCADCSGTGKKISILRIKVRLNVEVRRLNKFFREHT